MGPPRMENTYIFDYIQICNCFPSAKVPLTHCELKLIENGIIKLNPFSSDLYKKYFCSASEFR